MIKGLKNLGILLSIFLLTQCDFGKKESSENTSKKLEVLLKENRVEFARRLTKDEKSDYRKAELVVTWLTNNLDWKATDYKKRTVQEIIDRGGGNCNELAMVTIDILKLLKIKMRKVKEINLHVKSDKRQASAEKKVLEYGNKASVFGRIHNDHIWLEVYDQETERWHPADPSLGLIGYESWMKGRADFQERVTLDPDSRDMIIPVSIFSLKDGEIDQDITSTYMVDQLNIYYNGRLDKLDGWTAWKEQLQSVSQLCKGAINGEINLHAYEYELEKMQVVYSNLKAEYLSIY